MWSVVIRNETRKLIARRRTWAGFATYLLFEGLVLLLLALPGTRYEFDRLLTKNGIAFDAVYSGLTLGTYMLLLTMTLIGGVGLALVATDLVSKEIEDGTLRLTLARPVSRLQLLAGKAAVGAAHTFLFVLFAGVTSALVAAAYTGRLADLLVFAPAHGVFAFHEGADAVWRYGRALLLLAISMQAVSALGFMFSCLRLKPVTAAGLTLMVLLVDGVLWAAPFLGPYRHHFLTHHLGCWLWTFEYLVPWTLVARSLILSSSMAATFWIVGAVAFLSRDLR
jgi:ABC-2 type transport system permease protein